MKSKYIVFAAMGFELVGIILGCIFIGHHVDKNYGTKGLGIVVLSVLGLTGWLVHVITLLRRMENQQDTP